MGVAIEIFPTVKELFSLTELKNKWSKDSDSFIGGQSISDLKAIDYGSSCPVPDNTNLTVGCDYEFFLASDQLFFVSFIKNDPVFEELDVLQGYNQGVLSDAILAEMAENWHAVGYSAVVEIKKSDNLLIKLMLISTMAELLKGAVCLKNDLEVVKSGIYLPLNFNKMLIAANFT